MKSTKRIQLAATAVLSLTIIIVPASSVFGQSSDEVASINFSQDNGLNRTDGSFTNTIELFTNDAKLILDTSETGTSEYTQSSSVELIDRSGGSFSDFDGLSNKLKADIYGLGNTLYFTQLGNSFLFLEIDGNNNTVTLAEMGGSASRVADAEFAIFGQDNTLDTSTAKAGAIAQELSIMMGSGEGTAADFTSVTLSYDEFSKVVGTIASLFDSRNVQVEIVQDNGGFEASQEILNYNSVIFDINADNAGTLASVLNLTQNGIGNVADVSAIGDNTTITLVQNLYQERFSRNFALISSAGDNSTINVLQDSDYGGQVIIHTQGDSNTVDVEILDGGSLGADLAGENNKMIFKPLPDSAMSESFDHDKFSSLGIRGNDNDVTISDHFSAEIKIGGNNNTVVGDFDKVFIQGSRDETPGGGFGISPIELVYGNPQFRVTFAAGIIEESVDGKNEVGIAAGDFSQAIRSYLLNVDNWTLSVDDDDPSTVFAGRNTLIAGIANMETVDISLAGKGNYFKALEDDDNILFFTEGSGFRSNVLGDNNSINFQMWSGSEAERASELKSITANVIGSDNTFSYLLGLTSSDLLHSVNGTGFIASIYTMDSLYSADGYSQTIGVLGEGSSVLESQAGYSRVSTYE